MTAPQDRTAPDVDLADKCTTHEHNRTGGYLLSADPASLGANATLESLVDEFVPRETVLALARRLRDAEAKAERIAAERNRLAAEVERLRAELETAEETIAQEAEFRRGEW